MDALCGYVREISQVFAKVPGFYGCFSYFSDKERKVLPVLTFEHCRQVYLCTLISVSSVLVFGLATV